MIEKPANIAIKFYEAFADKNILVLANLYHPDLEFSDPAFGRLNYDKTIAMWEMLLSASHDLVVTYNILKVEQNKVQVEWLASYSFGKKQRPVNNRIIAQLTFDNDKIIAHHDNFNLYRWAKQALGLTGWLIGWTAFFKKRMQQQANVRLDKYMAKKN